MGTLIDVSMMNALVVVLDAGCVDDVDVPQLLAGQVAGARHDGGWWDLVPVADGSLFLRRHSQGADVLTALFSSGEFADDPDRTLAWTTRLITDLAQQRPVRFAYFSRYERCWGEPMLSHLVRATDAQLRELLASSATEQCYFAGPPPEFVVGA